jgi:hypothetical protein
MPDFKERLNSSPCCANCKHWSVADAHNENLKSARSCMLNKRLVHSGEHGHWQNVMTLDLSLCSKWEQKAND